MNKIQQGENIDISLTIDIPDDFTISIYPHYYQSSYTPIIIQKSQMSKIGNKYTYSIPYTDTKIDIGFYDLEVMFENTAGTHRSIFKKENAFLIENSHSKTL